MTLMGRGTHGDVIKTLTSKLFPTLNIRARLPWCFSVEILNESRGPHTKVLCIYKFVALFHHIVARWKGDFLLYVLQFWGILNVIFCLFTISSLKRRHERSEFQLSSIGHWLCIAIFLPPFFLFFFLLTDIIVGLLEYIVIWNSTFTKDIVRKKHRKWN